MGKYYWPVQGGIENHCYHLCVRLNRHVDLTVVVSNTVPRRVCETVEGVRVIRVPRYAQLASTPISPGIFRELFGLRADIVHVHLPNPMAEVCYLLARPRGKLVVKYHSDVIRQKNIFRVYRPVNELFLSRAERIIATAPQNVEHSPVLCKFTDRTRVIPLGIEPGQFERTPERAGRVAGLRRRFGDRVVFFIGRHVYYKGIDVLIRAMTRVDARLVIAGTGPLTPELTALSRSLGLDAKVSFVGRVADEDLPDYYHASDVFCLPSVARSEAFGIVQLEAMASGVPVVNTRLQTGMSYVNLDGVTGLQVPPGDAEALAGALNRLLDDASLRQHLGQQARERVHREFTHDINARRTLELYAEILAR